MTSQRSTSDGELAYTDTGTGPAVLLLHGGGLDHRLWDAQLPALTSYRALAADARGHGASASPTAPFRSCDDAVAVLDHAGVERAVLVGLSLGAAAAVETAVEHPDRVAGLVVGGAGGGTPDFRDPWVLDLRRRWAEAQAAGDVEGWIEAFMRFVPGPHRARGDVDPAVDAHVEAMVRDTVREHVVGHLARGGSLVAPTAVEVADRRRGVQVPVLAVHGGGDSEDHLRMAREVLEEVDDGREVVVDRAGHYPNLEDPDGYNAALTAHLARVGAW